MKRKLFTFLVAFLATLSGAVWAAETNPSGTSNDAPYDLTNGALEITDNGSYWVTSSSQTNNGITINGGVIVTNHITPTIYLVGIDINVSGQAINITGYADPTFVILGENKITSSGRSGISNEPAINIARLSTLTVSSESTGILDINMTGSEAQNQVAIGNAGLSVDPFYDCGSFTVKGGTIKTNGYFGEFDIHGFRLQENAVVIAKNIEGFDFNNTELRNGGLLFLDDETPYIGVFHNADDDPEFVLNSPLPEPYQIELRQSGVKLEIGEGQSLNEDQLIDLGGEIKGYKVSYTSPETVNSIMNYTALPSTKYVGKTYTLETWDVQATPKEQTTVYQPINTHWLNGTTWNSAGETITEAEPSFTTLTNIETKTYQAVWTLSKKDITYALTAGYSGTFNLWYPDNAPFTAEEKTGDGLNSLNEAGLKLSDDSKNTINAGTTPLSAGSFIVKMNLTTESGPSAQEATINVTTTSDKLNIGSNDITVTFKGGDFVYDGTKKTDLANLVEVKGTTSGSIYAYGTHYTLEFYQEDIQDGNEKDFQDAGTYHIKVVANPTSSALTGYKELSETIEIKPATLNVTAVSDVEWTISSSGNPDYSKAEFTLETIYNVDNVKDDVSINTKNLTTSVSESYKTTPGIYNVSYSDLVLGGSRSANYKLDPATASGKLIVKKTGTEQDPINPNPDDGDDPIIKPNDSGWTWKDNGWTRIYDGENHLFTAISVTYTDETTTEGTKTVVLTIDKDATVTYSTDEAGQNIVNEIKNQGTYYAHIEITKADFVYSGKVQPIKLVITARSITVTLGGLNAEHIGKDNLDANDFVTDWGAVVDNEKGKISGAISVANEATEGKYKVTFSNLKLIDNQEGKFLAKNYTATFKYGTTEIVGGNGEIDIEIPDWKPGEDIKPGEGGWTWDGKLFTRVYDGKEHPITSVQIKQGEDWKTIAVSNVTYAPKQPVKDAGLYWATFTVEGKKAVLPLKITQREMKVTFNVPNHIESTDPITITDTHVIYEKQSGNRGLVTNEAPEIESGEFVFEESSIEGKYKVILRNFVLGSSNTFNPDNYKLQIWDATQGIYVEYDNTGDDDDDITIIDPEHPDNNPNEPGGGVVVGPDDEGQQPSKNFCNIYVAEGSSPFIQFNPSRRVVEAVGKITVDVVIPDEIGTEDVKLTFRRGDGAWEALTIDEETQKYTIKDINTHIYLKAEVDAALLDAEPNENHVYIDLSCTKDGIKLDADREIVENGGDVLIKAEVSKENQNKAIKYEYKVTRFGAWKELKATENIGEFIIWNVTNDVFVRAYLADQTEDPETAEAAHHVYSDLSVTCKGLYLDADRKMVADNGTTKVYLTIEPNYNVKNAHYMFRRGIHEAWEELTPSTEANVFVVTGIESDIYLKATDAVPTGMEDIDGTARVYAKDGSLYIYTPQQDDITVVSMTGAVVKRTKQIGLQSYPLNQGIYVVRVGEQVFKVRVK